MNRTEAYQMTVRMVDGQVHPEDEQALDMLKIQVSQMGKAVRRKFYVKLQGRLGKDNPNAYKYRRGNSFRYTHQAIRLSDAQTADAYIYERR